MLKKILIAGCGCVTVLALCVVVLVAIYWKPITGRFQTAATTFEDLRTVQAALQKKYETTPKVMTRRDLAVSGSILSVEFTNLPFLKGPEAGKTTRREVALEIATTARDALPAAGRYDNYEVIFVEAAGVGVTYSESERFLFSAGDLPAPT